MKKYIFTIVVLCIIASCDSYLEKHQPYMENGEIVYLQKLDSISILPGDKRALFKFFYLNGSRLDYTLLSWNNRANFLKIDCNGLKSGKDSIIMLYDLDEGVYDFEISNFNKSNQKSLKVDAFISIYGDQYASTLKNRKIKNVSLEEDKVNIEFYPSSQGYQKLEIKYLSDTDMSEKIIVLENGNIISLNEVPKDLIFQYRTFYKPELLAIDLFHSSWSDNIKIDIND